MYRSGPFCNCVPSGPELCDGRDNDCDGIVDDDASCPGAGEVCVHGACVCPSGSLCDGTCRDLALDADNCGACGHACRGAPHARGICGAGRCDHLCDPGWANCDGDWDNGCETSGTCTPKVLATIDNVSTMIRDGSSLYVVTGYDDPALWRLPADGGRPGLVRRGYVDHLALSGTDLVWTEPGGGGGDVYGATGRVFRLAAGDSAPKVLAHDEQLPTLVATYGREVFFEDAWEPACFGGTDGSLRSVSQGASRLRATSPMFKASSLFLSADHEYWIDVDDADSFHPRTGLYRAARSCTRRGLMAKHVDEALRDASAIYGVVRSHRTGHALVRLAPGGGYRQTLATGAYSQLEQDASSLYVVEAIHVPDEARVVRFAKTGGRPAVLYDGTYVEALGVTDTWVYLAVDEPAPSPQPQHEHIVRVPR